MSVKKGLEGKWREAPVLLREDILVQAQAIGLDISDICNRALAGATGIAWTEKKPPAASSPDIGPVINADDPRSASAVKQAPRKAARKAVPSLPGRVSGPETPPAEPPRTPPKPAGSPEKKPAKSAPAAAKKGKGPAIRRFVAEAVSREISDECHVAKDTLYETFARWCREHRISPVPDRKAVTVALKNQFAMKETTVDGEPAWLNIRLKT
jgi:hypothetical protein